MKRSASKAVSTCRVPSRRQHSSRYSSISAGICCLGLTRGGTENSSPGYYQDPERDRMPILNVEHIACNVSEPNAMAAWYVEHLGMRIVRRLSTATHTHFLADAKGRVV